MLWIGRDEVRAHLTQPVCIPLMREAMIALSAGRSQQLLRQIIGLGGPNMFGVMPGSLDGAGFGAKLVSIFPGNAAAGGQSHQGIVALFDAETGAVAALAHAGEITAIRTAAASAAATDALARNDAHRLAILGTGEQAWQHVSAIRRVRALDAVTVWGRDAEAAEALAERIAADFGLPARAAATVAETVADADIICTTTAAAEPILLSEHVRHGTHINAIGSSRAGPAEIDNELVARSRFFADHREGVLRQGAEFLNAKAAGLIGDDHIRAEIGEVFAETAPGRLSDTDVTIYKSLGCVAQDLACAAWLLAAARECKFGIDLPDD